VHVTKNASIDAEWAQRFAHLLGDGQSAGDGSTASGATGVPTLTDTLEILTPLEMARADQLAEADGTSGLELMERAGLAVAEAVHRIAPAGTRVGVLTGPGNNGGDGFVAARILAEAGYLVSVGMVTARDKLKGDAAFAGASWTGFSKGLSAAMAEESDVFVDALFGAGLDRNMEGTAAQAIDAINRTEAPVVAVDLPSGVNGRDGRIMGTAVRATETVTFFRLKPGHLLFPGRALCGPVTISDIGIPASAIDAIRPQTWRNAPGLWALPPLSLEGHKYSRGHVLVVSGPASRTGAARLAVRGAQRSGAGLATLASPISALDENATHLTAAMVLPMDGSKGLAAILTDERKNVVVMGPGLGLDELTTELVQRALASRAAVVLDADALTSFAGTPERLFGATHGRSAGVVLTPHAGEFSRLFPELSQNPSKVERARLAAEVSGAVIVLKGPDTVVAAPDGRAAIASNAPPQLATAGSGDVLAGIVGGLLAQGMEPFAAASAAVWLHGEAGRSRGRGLIAEDLPEALPDVFAGIEAGA
jgi:hydroxyethylthiazole kinase-like uncharacterized protein yjeF